MGNVGVGTKVAAWRQAAHPTDLVSCWGFQWTSPLDPPTWHKVSWMAWQLPWCSNHWRCVIIIHITYTLYTYSKIHTYTLPYATLEDQRQHTHTYTHTHTIHTHIHILHIQAESCLAPGSSPNSECNPMGVWQASAIKHPPLVTLTVWWGGGGGPARAKVYNKKHTLLLCALHPVVAAWRQSAHPTDRV